MTRDTTFSNTANRRAPTVKRRSGAVRHEASHAPRRAPASCEMAVPRVDVPEMLISVKSKRKIHYGPDVGGPKATYELKFRTSLKRSLRIETDSPDLLRPDRVIDKVIEEHGLFPSNIAELREQIRRCTQTLVPTVERTTITGWRGGDRERAFVTPARTFGKGRARYEFASSLDHMATEGQVGGVVGSLAGWREAVGQYLEMSSAGRVLLGAALAAPLLDVSGLSESWIFLLAGRSTTGKSTLLNGASSFQGASPPISPRTTDRRFNELAAKHNHLLFVVGDLSQLNNGERRRVLHWLVMDATAGQPRSVSRTMRSTLPDLPFTTIAALSAEQNSAEIAEGAGVRQLIGETVRCFDLMSGRRGYFDVRPKVGRLKPEEIAGRINEGVVHQHGSALKAWIEWLSGRSQSWLRSRVGRLIDEFVQGVDPDRTWSSLERRAARKFGLVYAGLVMGRKAQVTTLSRKQAFLSVRKCLRRAMASTVAASPEAALMVLKRALRAPDAMLRTYQGGQQVKKAVKANPDWLALDTKRNGKRMIGLRASSIRKTLGDVNAQIAFDKLVQEGWLRMPKGKARWQKKIPGAGKIRLLELQPDWLDRGR